MPPHATTAAATRMCDTLRRLDDPVPVRRDRWVQGVYRSAINLAADDGTLVTIALERVGGLPRGILVGDVQDFRTLGISPGMAATMGSGSVTVGSALHIELASARPWSATLQRRDASAWRDRAPLVQHLAMTLRSRHGIDASPGARSALDDLGLAITRGDRPAVTRAADRLIGLGPGLTPSGDDALAGVEAALHVAGHPLAGSVADALSDLDRRTTTVSAAMLRHAVRGEASERVQRLLDTVLGPTNGRLHETLRDAVDWGATSGADTLAGVIIALDAATSDIDRWQAA